MKIKILNRLLGIFTAITMLFSITSQVAAGATEQKQEGQTDYPYVYVHGLFGWGRDEGINKLIPYWGATACDLMKVLNAKGYESYDASVGPISSMWDRACELYAQITGTRVDYGAAHSSEHNHARYGRDYSEPMIDGWGQADKNGDVKKINLVGHSFGGGTIRLLTSLLANGSAEEQAATPHEELSPLFAGGKANWVHSVTTICSPHNGTTLAYIIEEMNLRTPIEALCYTYSGIAGRSFLNGFVDFHLEQFGITSVPGSREKPEISFIKAFLNAMTQNDKSTEAFYPEEIEKINEKIDTVDGVYYFSYAYQGTRKALIGNLQVPTSKTFLPLRPLTRMLGAYSTNHVSDYPIDESWLPNDGLVNVVSALYPFGEPFENYNGQTDLKTGVWNVMPVREGHHGTPVGLCESRSSTIQFYDELTELISSLPKTK